MDQDQLVSRISTNIVIPWDVVFQLEQRDMVHICSLADIDFEFVLDSSGSIGPENWNKTTHLIAQHWIQETIKPSGSPQCGNHVAIRRYSESYDPYYYSWYNQSWLNQSSEYESLEYEGHFFDLDFRPSDDWSLKGFTNYPAYVTNVLKNLTHIASGTDTAGALERVREEDIDNSRNRTTYVMVFTDGASNDPNNTIYQAELLHPLVDEVFAFGIGDWINDDELQAIASKPSNVKYMENFENYFDYISQFIILQGGCKTSHIKPYRAINFNEESLTPGLS